MKSSRRGGLGKGLGALIQSTAEPDAAQIEVGPQVPEREDAKTNEKTGAPKRRASAPTHSTDSTAVDALNAEPGASDAPARKQSKTPAASTKTKKPASTPTETTADPTSKGASSTTAGTEAPATQGATATQDATATPADNGTTSRGRSTGRQRPVDVFFTGAEGEGTPEAARRGGKTSRPTMPTVKAPATRTRAARQKTGTDSPGETESAPAAPIATEPTEPGTVSPDIAVLREVPVGDIHPNPRQPREVFDEAHMQELVTSIREVGVLQPVVVREVDGPTPYELIMGERRWRATQEAGLTTIPAIVRQTPDEDLLRDALLENLHRSELNPLEEAAAYQQLMEDFSCTQEELSQRIGRSRPQISNTLRLLRLPPLVQRRVAAGTLSAGHARALLGLSDPAEMERLAQRIVTEGLSVRATEEAVAQLQGPLRSAPKATRERDESTRHERLDYFATALTSRLDTQVKITLGARKGRIAIDFASVEDLNRIMDLIQGEGTSPQG